jgi:hypothetical protein
MFLKRKWISQPALMKAILLQLKRRLLTYNRSKGSRTSAHIPAPRMWSAEATASLRSFLSYDEFGRVM